MNKSTRTVISLGMVFAGLCCAQAQSLSAKKALFINSYHQGYIWSDQEEQSCLSLLATAGVQTKVFRMDTYREKSAEHLTKVSEAAKALIDKWKPDVVIVADDPVMKGLYVPFYKDKDLPFVSCGINWDASDYGLPDPNVKNFAAILEVCPVKELAAEMNKIKPGKTFGFLSSDSLTPRKDAACSSKILGVKMETVFAKDFAAWKKGFLDLQGKVNFLIIAGNQGIDGWDEEGAVKFVEENAKVVSGTWHDFLSKFAIVSFNKLGAEHGEWAANTAVQVLKGASPASIPFTENKKGELVINARIAKKVGVTPSFDLMQSAKVIE